MRSVLVALLVCASACGAELDNPGLGGNGGIDAGGGGTTDSGGGGTIDAAIDAPTVAACSNGRIVYLNFGGVALTQGVSDATLNRASWLQLPSSSAPPYRQGVATRAADIQAITDGVRARLSSFPVEVVTTRPAAGQYVMIVFGGTANQVASRFGGAVNQLDCGDLQRNDVAWIADNVTPTTRVVNFAIGAIGFGLGLTATQNPTDCMCGWDNTCTPNNAVDCVLNDNIARDPAANQRCAGLTMQNETQAFSQAFCQ
ncbi:MAG: hypothetical protein JWP01_1304 [Myxococcales bacterium]|nr:hypothetical protein [Myxococcales bacterium]